MPSSTSSSDKPALDRRWARTWALALAIVLVVTAAWELGWRARGFRPSVSDDIGVWAIERDRADREGQDAVVIVGSSRVKSGLVPQALAEATGWRTPVQLAINFSSPVLAFEDLANDPDFHGLVIVDVAPIILFNAFWPIGNSVQGYLDHRASQRWSESLEVRLGMLLESSVVFRLPALSGKHLPATWWKGEEPARQAFHDDASRVTRIMEAGSPTAPLAGDGGAVPLTPEAMNALVARINAAIARLRSHQGRAIFVATPTRGTMAEVEGRLFPREKFWDVFARGIDAPSVRCSDQPELARFLPADGSHFLADDAAAFSRELGPILVRRLSEDHRAGAMPAASAPALDR